jgi:hypothetical protein
MSKLISLNFRIIQMLHGCRTVLILRRLINFNKERNLYRQSFIALFISKIAEIVCEKQTESAKDV